MFFDTSLQLRFLCCTAGSFFRWLYNKIRYYCRLDSGRKLIDVSTYDQSALNKIRKEQAVESEIPLKVYPIPATDFINIEITPIDTGRLILELYNNSGVSVLNKTVLYQPVLQVNVSDIPSGIYYLKVFQPYSKNQFYRVEKIIKY